MLLLILTSIRFLAWQGLAFRGHGRGDLSDLIQMLRLRGEDSVSGMAGEVWQETCSSRKSKGDAGVDGTQRSDLIWCVRRSPFLTVMVDETRDLCSLHVGLYFEYPKTFYGRGGVSPDPLTLLATGPLKIWWLRHCSIVHFVSHLILQTKGYVLKNCRILQTKLMQPKLGLALLGCHENKQSRNVLFVCL